MFRMVRVILFFALNFLIILLLGPNNVELKSLNAVSKNKFHSDAIVTYWPSDAPDAKKIAAEADEPGFMRRQLIRFGEMTSRVGNAMGAHATKITSAIDKICEVIKTIIPVIAAVCHVGQFKFCTAATEAPDQLALAMNPSSIDLNIPD